MSGKHAAQVRALGGVPTLFIDGRPHPGLGYLTFVPEKGRYEDFARAGVDLVALSATSDFHLYGLCDPVWIAPGVYDYRGLDRQIAHILRANPSAWLLPRVYVGSPPWWDETHPEELVRYADGSTRKPLHEDALKLTVPSFSSTAWRHEAGEALARLVRFFLDSDYADRIIGIQLTSAETEEWFYCGTYQGFFSDYSEPHRRGFRSWLRGRYGDDRRLEESWGRRVRIDDVEVPSEERRRGRECHALRDPRRARDVIDYTIFRGEDLASAIAHFARIVKTESAGRLLCGAFYGYVMELACHPMGLHLSGHTALGSLLASPDLDFLSSPTSYINRQVRGGESHFMSIPDSIRLHGKLWFNENDVRTHRLPAAAGHGRTADVAETIAIQRRESAHSLARGAGMWWFDMSGGWYDDREVMEAIARLAEVARGALERDRSSVSDVAVFVDPESLAGVSVGNDLGLPLLRLQLSELGRLGAPFDLYLFRDLANVRPYRLYLFLSPLFIHDPTLRDALTHAVKRDGRVAVWVFAPGAAERGFGAAGVARLTGIHCRMLDESRLLQVTVDASAHPIGADLRPDLAYGTPAPLGPVFVIEDPKATVLGRYSPGGEAALAVKSFDGWTSVYSACPNLPAPLLRGLLRFAGGHVYVDREALVWANRSFLGVQPIDREASRLRLPDGAVLRDLLDGGRETSRVFETDFDPAPDRITLLERR